MDNFKVIYNILKYLEASLDCEEFDPDAVSPFKLGITRERLEQLLIMMQDDGYIRGIVCTQALGDSRRHICEPITPEITIKGLEYLAENNWMKKATNLVKGIKDTIPGM